jgi:hypothetical protein
MFIKKIVKLALPDFVFSLTHGRNGNHIEKRLRRFKAEIAELRQQLSEALALIKQLQKSILPIFRFIRSA